MSFWWAPNDMSFLAILWSLERRNIATAFLLLWNLFFLNVWDYPLALCCRSPKQRYAFFSISLILSRKQKLQLLPFRADPLVLRFLVYFLSLSSVGCLEIEFTSSSFVLGGKWKKNIAIAFYDVPSKEGAIVEGSFLFALKSQVFFLILSCYLPYSSLYSTPWDLSLLTSPPPN